MSSGDVTTRDGVQIFLMDRGLRDAQPVMLRHSWPFSADDRDAQMLFFLASGYQVVAHDRRGHGRSSQAATGADMDRYATGAFAVAEHLDLTDAMHIGRSAGDGEVARNVARFGRPMAASPRRRWRGAAADAQDHRQPRAVLPRDAREPRLGHGFALRRRIEAYCVEALTVTVNPDAGAPSVGRVAAGVDSGKFVKPDGVRNQVGGELILSASRTMFGRGRFVSERVAISDWSSLSILRLSNAPAFSGVRLIDRSTQAFLDAGETAQAPTAPAPEAERFGEAGPPQAARGRAGSEDQPPPGR